MLKILCPTRLTHKREKTDVANVAIHYPTRLRTQTLCGIRTGIVLKRLADRWSAVTCKRCLWYHDRWKREIVQ